MGILENRTSEDVIKERFIRATLREYGENVMDKVSSTQKKARTIDKTRSKKGKRRFKVGFSDQWAGSQTISVESNTLTYRIPRAQRFADMKKIKYGEIVKKKRAHSVYNKPTMYNKKLLIRKLLYGFTEEVKNQFRKLVD